MFKIGFHKTPFRASHEQVGQNLRDHVPFYQTNHGILCIEEGEEEERKRRLKKKTATLTFFLLISSFKISITTHSAMRKCKSCLLISAIQTKLTVFF